MHCLFELCSLGKNTISIWQLGYCAHRSCDRTIRQLYITADMMLEWLELKMTLIPDI